jgi:hypothetical protein
MTKRTINRSLGPLSPEVRNQIIDKWIEVAGELPAQKYEICKPGNREIVTYIGSAREALHSALQYAHNRYLFADSGETLRKTKQLLAELQRIESAAHRLMMLVRSDARAVRDRFGLQSGADVVVTVISQALAKDPALRSWQPRALYTSSGRIEMAIEGVHNLHLWAKAATEENLQRITRMHSEKIGTGHARHRGDVALNQYIEAVVEECWRTVWGKQISDGPKLWKFVMEAAAGIDVRLSQDASRERIRRVFDLRRRANRSGLGGDLPTLRTRGSKHQGSGGVKQGNFD